MCAIALTKYHTDIFSVSDQAVGWSQSEGIHLERVLFQFLFQYICHYILAIQHCFDVRILRICENKCPKITFRVINCLSPHLR
jgi:hypothetical protein